MIDDLEKLAAAKILDLKTSEQLDKWRESNAKIVFTNGCFDILHVGHLSYLMKAATLGNKLIVGLNADQSVKKLKGQSRPINPENDRALLLASLYFVDAVIVFEEETPIRLIKEIMPDVLVKGGDYTIDTIVGAQEVQANGGEVAIIKFLEGHSSTAIIDKINNA